MSREGAPPRWKFGDWIEVTPGAGDIVSVQSFGDFRLQLEFWLPSMLDHHGQDRANSGVYLHGRWEIQILDSFENPTYADGACGALYRRAAPLVNSSRPPETWQSYEIEFRAPSCDCGAVTVWHNGALILDNLPLGEPTGGGLTGPYEGRGPLLLQDHGCAVRFRNIRVTCL